MNPAIQQWIANNAQIAGVLAFGVHGADKSSFTFSCHPSFSAQALENAWRCVAETIAVLQLNRFPTARFRWVFKEVVLHCERRRDGICLGIFAKNDAQLSSASELDRLLIEFHGL
jgi:hypothetical protein